MFNLKILIPCLLFVACKQAPIIMSVKTGHEGEGMPKLSLLLMDKKSYYSTTSLPKGKTNVVFYFSPTCPYCRVQMRTIVSNMSEFKDIQFTAVTIANYEATKHFYERYNLSEFSNVVCGIDTGFVIPTYFQTNIVPLTAIYDKSGALQQVFSGGIGIKQLKEVLRLRTVLARN